MIRTLPVAARTLTFTAALLVCLAQCTTSRGADTPKPEVKAHTPLYLRAGHTTTITLYGENLAPASASVGKAPVIVKLLGAKATEGEAKAKGSRQVTVEAMAPHGAAPQTVDLTLTQSDGAKVSLSLPLLEDVAVETAAKKPNGSYAQAMPLSNASMGVSGALEGDTPVTFRCDAKAGDTWDFTVVAGRIGSALDAVLRVRDSRHLPLALAAGNPKLDRHIRFRAPSDGSYYLEITDDQARGGPTFTYVLTAIRR